MLVQCYAKREGQGREGHGFGFVVSRGRVMHGVWATV